MKVYDLLGIGIGPFNLSLAALADSIPGFECRFFDQKPGFSWHSELMLEDAYMQTSWLKDLVTPVAPTNPHSFLNYLVHTGRFFAFVNTNRSTIKRKEFEAYCQWVAKRLPQLRFDSQVTKIEAQKDCFVLHTNQGSFAGRNLVIGTGLQVNIPEQCKRYLGSSCFFAKSKALSTLNLTGKRLLIIGGGQTGTEIALNAARGRWGQASQIKVISRRANLEPLDETPFTNDYFTPKYVRDFQSLDAQTRERVVGQQKLSSDGITPTYLEELYRELYDQCYLQENQNFLQIFPHRHLLEIEPHDRTYVAQVVNHFTKQTELFEADVVILATGFKQALPEAIEGLHELVDKDHQGRPLIDLNFQVQTKQTTNAGLFAMNLARHTIGISEPQVSLMAWRSAQILNRILGCETFQSYRNSMNFINLAGAGS